MNLRRNFQRYINLYNYVEAYRGNTLPSGYTKLEYIESDGTQYIDTGITDITNSEFILDAQATTLTGSFPTFLGAYKTSFDCYKVVFGISVGTSNFYTQVGVTNANYTYGSTNDTNRHIHKLVTGTNNGVYTIDNNSYSFSYGIQSETSLSLYLCARNKDGSPTNYMNMRAYSLIVKKDGKLIHEFIPAKRNFDNAIGMYDRVTNTFFTNQGTGSFIAGPESSKSSNLVLQDAIKDGLKSLKAYGKTEIKPDTLLDTVVANGGTEILSHDYMDSITAKGKIEQRKLPVGYQELEYIQSTGTQYIDTGINYDTGDSLRIITDLQYTDTTITAQYFGIYAGAYFGITNGSWSVGGNAQSTADTQKHTFDFSTTIGNDQQLLTLIVDGTSYTRTRDTQPGIMGILNTGTNSNYFNYAKLYNVKIYKNNTLILNGIPARNASGVIGMYDTVSCTFFTNSGTGSFIAGPLVNLPEGYVRLEYIESTGTQYIDTGYKSSNNTKVKAQILCPSFGTFIFGSRNDMSGDNQKRFGLFFNTTWNPQYANQNGTGSLTNAGTVYNIEMSQDGFYVNGSLNTSFASMTFSGDYNMYLFANNTADTTIGYGSCKIYSFEIYTNNVLEHKYIPCMNLSNVLGMYDTVSGQFFTNAGTGTFTAGPSLNVPSNYTVLDYIETTDGTEYIDPQISGNARWVITAQTNAVKGSSQSLITSTDSASGGTWYGEFTSTQHWDIISGGTTIAPTTKTTADLTFDSNGAIGTIGGVSVTRSIDCTQGNWRIFGTVSGIGPYVGKLFEAKAYQNNTLTRNLVPVIRNSDDTIGLYDTVNSVLYTNSGTGAFKAGYKANILPDNPVDIYCNNGVLKVRHQSGLPFGYTLIEYIESTGTQWIDTGIKEARLIHDIAFTVKNTINLMGNSASGGGYWGQNRYSVDGFELATQKIRANSLVRQKIIFDTTSAQATLTANNETISASKEIDDRTYFLFRINSAPYYCSARLWSFQAYDENNTLIQNLIPCRRNSDSELGMYDTVTGTFFTNQGTDTFIAGNPVDDLEIYTDGTTETIYKYGKNLFNEKWNKDTGTSTQSGTWGQVVTAAGWSTSELIPVVAGEKYTASYSANIDRQYVFYYNVDGTMQQSYNDKANTTLTVTIPANCTYVRMQCHKSGTALNSIQTQFEVGSSVTTYEPYTHDAEIATCENLFGLYSYQDTQNILNGSISRNIKVLVLDGTENWVAGATGRYYLNITPAYVKAQYTPLCSHFQMYTESGGTGDMAVPNMLALYVGSVDAYQLYAYPNSTIGATVNTWKQWLADQYNAGTPVMIVYPLATATSETVAKQISNKDVGDTIGVIAGSLEDLEVTNTSSTHTIPLPDYPLDITCNNGVLKLTTGFDINRIYKTGNPSVSNEGIYTTNSSQSYVRTQNDVNFSTANSWSFKWKFTYKRANTDQGIMSGEGKPNVQAIINSAGKPRFSIGDNTDWSIIWNDSSLTFAYQEDVEYENEIYFNGTRYGYKVNGIEIGGVDSTARAANTYFALGVERQRTSTQYTRCIWDLSKTSLIVDGVEQFPWIVGAITTDGTVETLWAHGKNLANVPDITNITSYPETNLALGQAIAGLQLGKTYTLSANYMARGSGGARYVKFMSGSTTVMETVGGLVASQTGARSSYTFTMTQQMQSIDSAWIYVGNGTQWNESGFLTNIQIEQGSTATEYEPYYDGGTATAEMLLKVGDYQDEQGILSGAVTRNVGVLVLDGTEEIWGTTSQTPDYVSVLTNCYTVAIPLGDAFIDKRRVYCTHLTSSDTLPDANARQGYALLGNGGSGTPEPLLNKYAVGLGLTTRFPTIAGLKQWLADQYAAGTPVIIVYPLATATTETVDKQRMRKGTVSITEASMTGLTVDTTESVHTIPSPDFPLDIICNNGVIKGVSKNLYNPITRTDGYYIGADGTIAQGSGTYCYSALIPVKSNTNYMLSGIAGQSDIRRLHAYDSNGNWVSQISFANTTTGNTYNITGTTPNNCAYVRISIPMADTNVQVEQGSIATGYNPYGVIVEGNPEVLNIKGKNLFDSSVFNTDVGETITPVQFQVPNGTYIMTTDFPPQANTVYTNVWIIAGKQTSGWDSATNGVSKGNSKTVTITDGWCTVAYRSSISAIPNNPKDYRWQLEEGTRPTQYENYMNINCSVEDLLSVGNYQDIEDLKAGIINRKVGIKVLDGTENWIKGTSFYTAGNDAVLDALEGTHTCICTHYQGIATNATNVGDSNTVKIGSNAASSQSEWFFHRIYITANRSDYATAQDFANYLAAQYALGTPVIIVYPLATETTESTITQSVDIVSGTNTIERDSEYLNDLGVDAEFKKLR